MENVVPNAIPTISNRLVEVYAPDDGKWKHPIEVALAGDKSAGIDTATLNRARGPAVELAAADSDGPVEVKSRWWHNVFGGRSIVGHGNGDGRVTQSEVATADGLSFKSVQLFDVLLDRARETNTYVEKMKEDFGQTGGKISAAALQKEYAAIYGLIAGMTPFATDDLGSMALALPRPEGEGKIIVSAQDDNLDDFKQDLAWRDIRLTFERNGKPWLVVRYDLEKLDSLRTIFQGDRYKGQSLRRTIVESDGKVQTSRILLDLKNNAPKLLSNETHGNGISDAASEALGRLNLSIQDSST